MLPPLLRSDEEALPLGPNAAVAGDGRDLGEGAVQVLHLAHPTGKKSIIFLIIFNYFFKKSWENEVCTCPSAAPPPRSCTGPRTSGTS